jgi:hypothetical protein
MTTAITVFSGMELLRTVDVSNAHMKLEAASTRK